MSPSTGKGVSHRRASLKCTYCERAFSRTEHLTRHERSHRNEKPFRCRYCDAMFSRKDVIKRHHLRYHQAIAEVVGVTSEPVLPISLQPGPLAPVHSAVMSSSSQDISIDFSQGKDSSVAVPNGQDGHPDLLMDNYIINAFLPDLDFQLVPDEWHARNLSGTFMPSGLIGRPLDPPFWRGSLELSEKKRDQLFTRTKDVLRKVSRRRTTAFWILHNLISAGWNWQHSGISDSFEPREIPRDFFENFLDYLPFIHIPTWQAEAADPCLLLAMLAVGAGSYKEYGIAHALYYAAKSLLMPFLESTTSQASGHPLWVMQSLLITISYGVRSGEREMFDHAISWTSSLANAVRWSLTLDKHRDLGHDIQVSWQDWIENEMAVRTNWASYTVLCALTVCFNIPPVLMSAEMSHIPLPCNELEWSSATFDSWVKARIGPCQNSPCLGEALDILLGTLAPQINTISVFGTYVLLHAILQNIWALRRNIFLEPTHLASCIHKIDVTLERWHSCWEGNAESSVSPGNPYSAVTANPAALFRLAYMWVGVDFSLVRAAIPSHDPETIEQSFKQLSIPITGSDLTLKIIMQAVGALKTRVKLGMMLREQRLGCFQSLEVHLFSLECCLFSCAWLKATESRRELDWSTDEAQVIQEVREILSEVDLPITPSQKSDAVRVVYTWALILKRRAVWKLQKIIADSLERFAESF